MTSRPDTVDMTELEMVDIVDAGDFWDGEMDAFDVGDREVLVIKIDGEFHAFDGICPHQSFSLVDGALDGEVLTCRAHEWQFNAVSGLGINPANECLLRHACEVRDGVVYVSTEPIGRSADLEGSTVKINKPNEKG